VSSNISAEIIVKDLLDRHPRLVQLFMDMELMCVGCPAEAFHTLADVSREYHLDLKQLLQRIYKVIGNDAASQGGSPPKRWAEQP
jgi:hybrid cluster-associated redox disulfide protein